MEKVEEMLRLATESLKNGDYGVEDLLKLQGLALAFATQCGALAQVCLGKKGINTSQTFPIGSRVCYSGEEKSNTMEVSLPATFSLKALLPIVDYYSVVKEVFDNREENLQNFQIKISASSSGIEALQHVRALGLKDDSSVWSILRGAIDRYYSGLH
ncbi:hypothetical protein HQ45_09045 [Porphyromonas crevioricanis]|nr:hypothetical protein [Porphyromonas crevioricanis]KGN88820.1 hypothetical protein HQ45_09045 [Porphyromonas crevioricanis]KGN95934.1 hypothetical protein HQ38_02995 [Porphyromonas crevioricanis]